MFQLALIQMRVAGGEKQRNLGHAEELVAEAARGGAQIVLLPEVMDLGWTHSSALSQASLACFWAALKAFSIRCSCFLYPLATSFCACRYIV